MNLPTESPLITGALTSIATILAGVLVLRGKLSRDSVEIAKDKVERSELDGAVAELRRLRQQANDDARQIAQLTADNMHKGREIERLAKVIQQRTRGLPKEVRRLVDTGFVDLDSGGQGDRR